MTRSVVEAAGPWEHRYVAANGARFHAVVAEPPSGRLGPTGRTVVLLHGFPQFWWCWRAQLPALAAAGHRAVALDLRGYGGSDKTPRGYDPTTLAADVAGVIGSLGARQAAVVGLGWGGYVAWTAAVAHPERVSAVGSVSAPHPREMLHALWRHRPLALRHLLATQVPMLPERRVRRATYLRHHLDAWSAPGPGFPSDDEVAVYAAALRLWPAPHCALEYHRWLVRSRLRADGRAYGRLMRRPVAQPALVVQGALDPALPPFDQDRSARRVQGPVTRHEVGGAGHFVPEECPDELTAVLTGWLDGLPSTTDRPAQAH